jgi:hypothetical protein
MLVLGIEDHSQWSWHQALLVAWKNEEWKKKKWVGSFFEQFKCTVMCEWVMSTCFVSHGGFYLRHLQIEPGLCSIPSLVWWVSQNFNRNNGGRNTVKKEQGKKYLALLFLRLVPCGCFYVSFIHFIGDNSLFTFIQ